MDRRPRGGALMDRGDWDRYWQARPGEVTCSSGEISFRDAFRQHVRPGEECFEVGCFPGWHLVFLAEELGCRVGGVDFTSRFADMEALLARRGVETRGLVNADFLGFSPGREYDFVFSLGFVEHFRDFEEVIERHVALTRAGGTLMIACPNLGGLVQRVFHLAFDRRAFATHDLAAANPRRWAEVLRRNGMRTLSQGYYGTAGFWVEERPDRSSTARLLTRLAERLAARLDRSVSLPNRWTSPFVLSVSRKEAGAPRPV